jgi:SAM-dependent methyltransferase
VIDYDRAGVAATYRVARALSEEAVRFWTDAIRDAVGATPVRVAADIGAGTGRFTRVLAAALDATIVAVEPSDRMVAEREPVRAAFVRGLAEALPLRARSVDLAMLSMVYHQLPAAADAAVEVARVLGPGGLALVRTPTLDTLPDWLHCFPEALAIDRGRMPTPDAVVGTFRSAGMALRRHSVVHQPIAANGAEHVARIRTRAFSTLGMISDEAFRRGLAAWEAHVAAGPPDGPVREPLDFFVFERRG